MKIILSLIILSTLSGCVSRNTAEINAVKIERKPTAAEQANQWADFAEKLIKPITDKK